MNLAVAPPEQRQDRETAANTELSSRSRTSGTRVCLHPDRTAVRTAEGFRIECDYCPASVISRPGDVWPDIDPLYYEDPNRS